MDPRDVIYYTEYRIDAFIREREHQRLVGLAKLNPIRAPRLFRFFPSFWQKSEPTAN